MLKAIKAFSVACISCLIASPVLAGPYLNIENNAGWDKKGKVLVTVLTSMLVLKALPVHLDGISRVVLTSQILLLAATALTSAPKLVSLWRLPNHCQSTVNCLVSLLMMPPMALKQA